MLIGRSSTRYQSSGFTLIEVLVSMVVFALLMILVSLAFQQSALLWKRQQGTFSENLSLQKIAFQVVDAIEQAIPYKKAQMIESGFGQITKNKLFFSGQSRSLKIYSANGVFYDEPVLLTISCEESPNGSMALLITEQTEFSGKEKSKIWLTELEQCQFDYFAEPVDFRPEEQRFVPLPKQWFSEFHGKQFGYFPEVVRLNYRRFSDDVNQPNNQLVVALPVNFRLRFSLLEDDLGL
ncbi:MAG: prepilin-type N-terminal cleavage/methylation domain-containing protein [Gammaproteobacteria bacterium]|nr:prepilin-type N-terminal cleavage/methylation domain-containing protein [Gammaproteobacteria bacterium]